MSTRSPFPALLTAAAGLHAADQLAMAALPLTVVLGLGAGPAEVGLLLAVQAAAWLLCSLPAGLLVDRLPRRAVLLLAGGLAAGGLALALAGIALQQVPLLGLGTFVASAGTVIFVLAAGSVVPDLVDAARRPQANARLELARAVVTLLAPPLVGGLAGWGLLDASYALALGCVLLALLGAARLPRQAAAVPAPGPATRLRAATLLREGAGFVLAQPLLRGIALCALFWNMGFFALLTAFVPFALQALHFTPASVGLAQAGYGAGLLLGAALAPWCMRRLGPNAVLLIGPGASVLAPALLLATPALAAASHGILALPLAVAAQLLVGCGPMMWLVCQLSIRQAVTPRALLGRVGATLQVANYGVRPFGALAGGWLAAQHGPAAGIALAGGLFAASAAVVLLTGLRRLRAMPVMA